MGKVWPTVDLSPGFEASDRPIHSDKNGAHFAQSWPPIQHKTYFSVKQQQQITNYRRALQRECWPWDEIGLSVEGGWVPPEAGRVVNNKVQDSAIFWARKSCRQRTRRIVDRKGT